MRYIFRKLSIRGTREQLQEFVRIVPDYAKGIWSTKKNSELNDKVLTFVYSDGNTKLDSELSILCGYDRIKSGELKVSNIVPLNKAKLTIREYNKVLYSFYTDIIQKVQNQYGFIKVIGPTSDVFDIEKEFPVTVLVSFLGFIPVAEVNGNDDYLNDYEQKKWYEFIRECFLEKYKMDKETFVYIMTKDQYWLSWKHVPMQQKRAKALAHRYELEYDILEYCCR